MAQKEFRYRGKTLAELQQLDIKEFATLLSSRKRRTIERGVLKRYASLIKKIERAKAGQYKKPIKTHARTMVILPNMVGMTIHVHTGKTFHPVIIMEDMIGCYLGELALTRQRVQHSAPGIGATKSSTAAASKAK